MWRLQVPSNAGQIIPNSYGEISLLRTEGHTLTLSSPKRAATEACDFVSSLKTVNLTVWGEQAEKVGNVLEQSYATESTVVLVTNVRVSSFSGISLTTVNRSEINPHPELPEVQEMKDWYDLVGKAESLTPLSDGLPNMRTGYDPSHSTM